MEIEFEEAVRRAAPNLKVILMEAAVQNAPTSDALWEEIGDASRKIAQMPMEMVNKRPAIAATRAAYKALGKEPNRYRPSAEALCRRCVKGLELYRSLTVIDVINLLSIVTGHSIGGFDADRIEGSRLTLGVGRENEPYEAINRGQLNIACLPVFRDAVGGVGTPTSDNDRTKLSPATTRLVMTINLYDGGEDMDAGQVAELAVRALTRHAAATDIKYKIYSTIA